MIKVLTLLLITITGFVVLGGHTSVEEPTLNFHDAFEGKATAYGLTNALYKIIFSYAGYENAFNVVNEVKVGYFSSSQVFRKLTRGYRIQSDKSKSTAPLP